MALPRWIILTVGALALPAAADEITYRTHVAPLWEARCAACHGAKSPYLGEFEQDEERFVALGQGPRMDSYADLIMFVGWPDTGALMRRLDDGRNRDDGEPGNMYEHLGDDEAERQQNLATFKAWVGGDEAWTLKRWRDISKEELDRLAVPY
ncbi:cytochrome C [Ectothiorhodospiraceae bacterium 2226]|nr:cytochrome C [Ectothiorhodospiraceae bacterium 2226]